MWIISTNFFTSSSVPLIMMLTSILINSFYSKNDVPECGFDSFNVSAFPVSSRFSMFRIIFLVLDSELALMSLCPTVVHTDLTMANFSISIFVVLSGVLGEWLHGSLSWAE